MKKLIVWVALVLISVAIWAGIIAALAWTWAGYDMQRREAELRQQVTGLSQERRQLAGQIVELDRQLQELRESHSMLIMVSQDLDDRLAGVEGR